MSGRLLHIYDGDFNWLMRSSAVGRKASHTIKVTGGVAGFFRELDALVAKRMTFDRAVIESHGNAGMIFFKGQVIRASDWRQRSGRGYERLFPNVARIYFTGCNVADQEAGWEFLTEAGKLFLRGSGGLVFAHDSVGFAAGNVVHSAMFGLVYALAFKGKTIHPPWDTVKGVYIDAGGTGASRVTLPN